MSLISDNAAQRFIRTFPWIHIAIGLLGNVLFVAGSVCFVISAKEIGTWLFLLGSLGMLVGRVGEAIRMSLDHRLRVEDEHFRRKTSRLVRETQRAAASAKEET